MNSERTFSVDYKNEIIKFVTRHIAKAMDVTLEVQSMFNIDAF